MSATERGSVPFQGRCKADDCDHLVTLHLPRKEGMTGGHSVKVRCCECGTTNDLEVGYVEQ